MPFSRALSLTLSPLSRGEGKQFEWDDRSKQYTASDVIEFIPTFVGIRQPSRLGGGAAHGSVNVADACWQVAPHSGPFGYAPS